MKVTSFGKTYSVTPHVTSYCDNDSLAIHLLCDNCDNYEPFATLTVNLVKSDNCDKDCAFVDTNNCPWAEQFITDNELGVPTGRYGHSGFCKYPEYKFDLSKLRQEDSK